MTDHARFFASPGPALVHILGGLIYILVGAFQVSPIVLQRSRRWHRAAGWLLAPLGIATALSGAWLAHYDPRIEHDGPLLYVFRMNAAMAWITFILLDLAAIRPRDSNAHGLWMLRRCAIGMGASAQLLTHIPWLLLSETRGGLSRAFVLGAGWAITFAVVEWIVRERPLAAGAGTIGVRVAHRHSRIAVVNAGAVPVADVTTDALPSANLAHRTPTLLEGTPGRLDLLVLLLLLVVGARVAARERCHPERSSESDRKDQEQVSLH